MAEIALKKFFTNWSLRYPNSFCCLKNDSVIESNCIRGHFWKSDQYFVSIVYVSFWFNSDKRCLLIERKITICVVWFYVPYISCCFCKTYTMMCTTCGWQKYHVCVWDVTFIFSAKILVWIILNLSWSNIIVLSIDLPCTIWSEPSQ